MDAKKFTKDDIYKVIQESETMHLKKDLSDGIVLKKILYEGVSHEVSLLMLSPKARIKEHSHPEAEWYINLDKRTVSCFRSNKKHSLENGSDEKWLNIISIKFVD